MGWTNVAAQSVGWTTRSLHTLRVNSSSLSIDRHVPGLKEKFVLAATDLDQTKAWMAALREAGVADELRNELADSSTGGANYRGRSGGREASCSSTRLAHQL